MSIKKIKASPQMYVEMWLSGQIEHYEWVKILDENPEVLKEYTKHLHTIVTGSDLNDL